MNRMSQHRSLPPGVRAMSAGEPGHAANVAEVAAGGLESRSGQPSDSGSGRVCEVEVCIGTSSSRLKTVRRTG